MSDKSRSQVVRMAVLFAFVGALVVAQSVVDAHQRSEQTTRFQACITNQFTLLTATLTARANLEEKDRVSTRRVILTIADARKTTDPAKTVTAALEAFRVEQAEISAAKAKAPYPPYPDGKCT